LARRPQRLRSAPGPPPGAARRTARPLPAGLRAGDGVFETLRTFGGRPFLLERHLARLREGSRALGLAPVPSVAALRRACEEALSEAGGTGSSSEWIVRPMVYAAEGGPRLEVEVEPLRSAPGRRGGGLVVGVASYPHPGAYLTPRRTSAPVKWLARGPLAHALREARANGWDEALLEGPDGELVEGTRSNLLAVVNGRLVAPGAESHALPGITREVVLEDARRLGIAIEEHAVGRVELRAASELCVTSSLLGVAPISRLVGRRWAPLPQGPTLVAELSRRYDARTRGRGHASAGRASR